MKLSDIHIRDPFILPVDGTYYLYGTQWFDNGAGVNKTGIRVWKSTDLENWDEPTVALQKDRDGLFCEFPDESDYFWAPEVHFYKGAYYLFTTCYLLNQKRGTFVFKSERPEGPFRLHSDGMVTPTDWMSLDGTLYEENGVPYMVFCHEWVQIQNGTMCAVPLTEDLSAPAGETITLFAAGELPWGTGLGGDGVHFVTDGPFLHRAKNGTLQMIWSSFGAGGYFEAVSVSESGSVMGPWRHSHLLFENDGGHGMLFKKGEDLQFVFHCPNVHPNERPVLIPVHEDENGLLRSDA